MVEKESREYTYEIIFLHEGDDVWCPEVRQVCGILREEPVRCRRVNDEDRQPSDGGRGLGTNLEYARYPCSENRERYVFQGSHCDHLRCSINSNPAGNDTHIYKYAPLRGCPGLHGPMGRSQGAGARIAEVWRDLIRLMVCLAARDRVFQAGTEGKRASQGRT